MLPIFLYMLAPISTISLGPIYDCSRGRSKGTKFSPMNDKRVLAEKFQSVLRTIADLSAAILNSAGGAIYQVGHAGGSFFQSVFGEIWGFAATIVILLLVAAFIYKAVKLGTFPKIKRWIEKKRAKSKDDQKTETIEMT